MEIKENKEFIVYYQGIAAIMMLMGNQLQGIRENHNNTSLNIFSFKNNEKSLDDNKKATEIYFRIKNKKIETLL